MPPQLLRLRYAGPLTASVRLPWSAGTRGVLSIDTPGRSADYWFEPLVERVFELTDLRAIAEGWTITHRGLLDGAAYKVFVTNEGRSSCSCPHFEKRVGWDQAECRHVAALHVAGLLTKFRAPENLAAPLAAPPAAG